MAKRTQRQDVTPGDAELFRRTLGDVTPLRPAARVVHARLPPDPLPLQRLKDEQAALRESLRHGAWESGLESGEELVFVRDGIGAHTLNKLRRGHWIVQAELDLHGYTAAGAREPLAAFLGLCARRGLRCVRIIHGKGLRSRNRQPVLKQKVARWLAQRDEVLAYCQARSTEGGSGAVVVLLRGARSRTTGARGEE